MAQVIVGQPSPQPWDIISGAIDRYQQHRTQQQQVDLQRQGLAQNQQQIEQQGQYQQGQLGVQQGQLQNANDQLALMKSQFTDKQLTAEAQDIKARFGQLYDAIQAAQDPTEKAVLTKQAQDFAASLKARPEIMPYIQIATMEPILSPTRQADINSMRFDAQQTGRALNSTDPNAANYTTRRNLKADMPSYAFQQQQATDLQAHGGGSTKGIPAPTGNAVTDFERRATEAMPTSGQNLQSQTQITTTGMQEKGAMERAKIAAAARTSLPGGITIEPGTREYGIAQDVSSGKLTFDQFQKLYGRGNNPMKSAIYSTAREINPNFDPSAFELGYKFAQNKGIRQQIASADNALKMIPEAIAISDKATRLGPTALNKLIMSGGVMLGGQKYTDAQTLQKAFGDEISGALGFGSATDMTRELGLSMADLNFSSPNFRSAMKILDTFLTNKRGTLVNQMGPYGNTVDQFSGGNPGAAGGGGGAALSPGEAWAQKYKAKP